MHDSQIRAPHHDAPPSGTLCLRLGRHSLLLERRAWWLTLGLMVALTLLSLLALTLARASSPWPG